jgi:hypothetical protein
MSNTWSVMGFIPSISGTKCGWPPYRHLTTEAILKSQKVKITSNKPVRIYEIAISFAWLVITRPGQIGAVWLLLAKQTIGRSAVGIDSRLIVSPGITTTTTHLSNGSLAAYCLPNCKYLPGHMHRYSESDSSSTGD